MIALLVGDDEVDNDEQGTHHQGGAQAGQEQVADGGVGGDAVDHQRDAGGHDDAQAAGHGGQAGGVGTVILGLYHVGDQDTAHGGGGGRAGAGDGAEEHTGHHGGGAQAAGGVADELIGHVDQPLGQPARLHQGAGQHEAGDGHQGEGLKARVHLLGDEGQARHVEAADDGGDHAEAQGDAHGNADGEQHNGNQGQYRD